MTWSIDHTITYVDNTSNHSAFVYLFDTVLAGKTGWTVAAHPDASSFKRIANFSCTNRLTGASYTMYHWCNWSSTSPVTLNWYEDSTYTTTPGDLATNTTSGIASGSSLSVAGEDWHFCVSSVNSQSILVLKGSKLFFYWPGITDGVFWEDTAWDGSQQNQGTWVCPYASSSTGSLLQSNSPGLSSGSSTEYILLPDAGYSYDPTYRLLGNYIATNFNWMYTGQSSASTLDYTSHTAFRNGGHTDVGVWMPSSLTIDGNNRRPFYNSGGISLQVGTDYWYYSGTNLGMQGVIFNFGTTDPLA